MRRTTARPDSAGIEWRKVLLIAGLLAAVALVIGRGFVFGPAVLEGGDFAANAMSIHRAKSLQEIYGNYSRWGFNHPGPFFFYVYAMGEVLLFDLLHVVQSPHQAHVIFGVLLQSLFLAGAIAISLFLVRDRRMLLAWLGVGCVFAGIFYIGLTSIWPPHVLFGPYLLLLLSSAALSLGWFRFLPVVVLCVCVLCHGHIAQPLLTFPILLASLLGFLASLRAGAVVDSAWCSTSLRLRNVLWCVLIAGVFLLPIVLDLSRWPDGNVGRVLAYMKTQHGDKPSFGQAINYISSYFIFDRKPEWLDGVRKVPVFSGRVLLAGVIVIAAMVAPRLLWRKVEGAQTSTASKRMVAFCVLALLLALVWTRRITGPLYEFNSFFVYAVCALLAVSLVYWAIANVPKWALAPIVVVVAGSGALLVPKYMAHFQVFSQHSTIRGGAESVSFDRPDPQVAINQIDGQDWLLNMALAISLTRSGVQYWVPQDWTYVFGWKNAYPDDLFTARTEALRIFDKRNAQPVDRFAESEFCRISKVSPVFDTGGEIQRFNELRRTCGLVAAPFGRAPSDGEWEWISSRVVAFQLKARQSSGPVELSLDVVPYLGGGKIESQSIQIHVNGERVESRKVSQEGVEHIVVPADVWNRSAIVTVSLILDGRASPKDLGLSPDDRRLSIGLRGVGVRYPHH